jgi:hypothetical protein
LPAALGIFTWTSSDADYLTEITGKHPYAGVWRISKKQPQGRELTGGDFRVRAGSCCMNRTKAAACGKYCLRQASDQYQLIEFTTIMQCRETGPDNTY